MILILLLGKTLLYLLLQLCKEKSKIVLDNWLTIVMDNNQQKFMIIL
jgi:hypothetical protein